MKNLVKTKYKDMSIKELVEFSQQSDYDALEELIRREQGNVYASFYFLAPDRKDLSDLTQEALFKMARNIKSLKSPAAFKSWLNQIISNVFYDELRKKSRRLNVASLDEYRDMNENSALIHQIEDGSVKPDEKTLFNELDDLIKESMDKLPEKFRLAIVLREIQGLSYEEIAEITSSNIGTVKSRIARARTKLQETLKPYVA